jgi:flagellar M-ring protein FliF
MQTIKSFLDQSIIIWKESTGAARFGIILLLFICLGAIVGVGIWSAQPNYVSLANGLEPKQSGQLMGALATADINYKIRGAGSSIYVDEREFDVATVIAGKIGVSSTEAQLETASPWMDPTHQKIVNNRNLERQLANSIEQYGPIDSATVHLSIPERQPFLRLSEEPTASIVLKIAPNHRFNETQANAISLLVAHAVPGLQPTRVAISDTDGNIYSNDETLGRLTKQEEYRLNRERELTSKAQAMLVNFLGVGNSQVEITADFSFPEGRTTTTEYDPDKRVMTSETVDSSTTTDENPIAVGPAGTASNGDAARRGASSNKVVTSKTEVLESNYEVSSTLREDVLRTPILNLLTISVLVNTDKVQNEAKEIPASVRASLEALVKQAVGFREGTDQFNLEFFQFVDLLQIEETPASAFPWEKINSLLKNISLGVAALVALFLGLKVIKNMQPAPGTTGAALPSDRSSQVGQLSELVKQNPEVFSKIIAAWANGAQVENGPKQQSKAA